MPAVTSLPVGDAFVGEVVASDGAGVQVAAGTVTGGGFVSFAPPPGRLEIELLLRVPGGFVEHRILRVVDVPDVETVTWADLPDVVPASTVMYAH